MVIPDSVRAIGPRAFKQCSHLETITLSENLYQIMDGAFDDCGLTTITIPETVNTIGTDVFAECLGLETIYINKPENSISGAPWGARASTQIIWTG